DNTDVEFSRIEYSNSINATLNVITTSHQKEEERFGSELAYTMTGENSGFTLISHTHNHPKGYGDQSRPSTNNLDGTADIKAYQLWMQRKGSSFRVFIRYNGITREFDTSGNSKN